MTFTPNQLRAITEPGNLLVVAAAGAGKTGTLVERCARLLLRAENPVPIHEILVVTFTEAAAAEVRERIRRKLEEQAAVHPEDERLQEQLAHIDSAYISTLHSFCFEVVRRHVLQLGLDPAVAVLDQQQAKILFLNTLDLLLREHYGGAHDFSGELKEVIRAHFGGWDKPVREFVEHLYEFTQSRPAPEKWFEETLARLDQEVCPEWHKWYSEAVRELCAWWLPYLKSLGLEHKNGHECAKILENACAKSDLEVTAKILARDECWERKKGDHRPAFNKLFEEAEFLESLLPKKAGDLPLEEDWAWMRKPLVPLLKFAKQFVTRFGEIKAERGVVDFHDLEQLALRLLVDSGTGVPTALACEWQRKFQAVFVDEYQDINAAQDLILAAVSSQETPGNRFLVGDMKQSIYRFRQADPRIFRNYLARAGWQTIHLSENFRSHEGILKFVNPLFSWLMLPEVGGLAYDEQAQLKFGAETGRPEMKAAEGAAPPVELHVLFTDQGSEREDEEPAAEGEQPEAEEVELEARLVAGRLRKLKEDGFAIYHQKEKRRRAVEWKDMVVLLRAAKNKLETYAKAFAEAGVPLQTKRNAFFTTQEVLDLCNLLTILDNPLQDIPLVGVLRSPLAGLSANELAAIRTRSQAKLFWSALHEFEAAEKESVAGRKITSFLERFQRWRDARRSSSLAQRLDEILVETGYSDWLLTQVRGRERYANVRQLVSLARHFDESRGESLYLFLRHLEELLDAAGDIEPAGAVEENAVRLMTVHQSKGLEFPVVAVADLGKQFNFTDRASDLTVHEKFGLCAMVKPPHTGQRYRSLPLWLARRSDRFEALGEEMRVLYVALTRAQNHLLLFGKTKQKTLERWSKRAVEKPYPAQICKHQSALDWLGTFASVGQPGWTGQNVGQLDTFAFQFHSETPAFVPFAPAPPPDLKDASTVPDLVYPHEAATRQAAKTSVTVLRKKAEESDEVARVPLRFRGKRDGTERGLAMHTFLEHFGFETARDVGSVRAEADRLVQRGLLTAEQRVFLDFEAIVAFWTSKIGSDLLANERDLQRELQFTFKATRADLEAVGLANVLAVPETEFIVIQGVADLVRISPKEIWLIDFKSDRIENKELSAACERYRPQVLLYAAALSAIYRRPVTRKGIYFLHLHRFESFDDKNETSLSFQQLELYI